MRNEPVTVHYTSQVTTLILTTVVPQAITCSDDLFRSCTTGCYVPISHEKLLRSMVFLSGNPGSSTEPTFERNTKLHL